MQGEALDENNHLRRMTVTILGAGTDIEVLLPDFADGWLVFESLDEVIVWITCVLSPISWSDSTSLTGDDIQWLAGE